MPVEFHAVRQVVASCPGLHQRHRDFRGEPAPFVQYMQKRATAHAVARMNVRKLLLWRCLQGVQFCQDILERLEFLSSIRKVTRRSVLLVPGQRGDRFRDECPLFSSHRPGRDIPTRRPCPWWYHRTWCYDRPRFGGRRAYPANVHRSSQQTAESLVQIVPPHQLVFGGRDDLLDLGHLGTTGLQIDGFDIQQRAVDRQDEHVTPQDLRTLLVPERQRLGDRRILVDASLDLERTIDDTILAELDDRHTVGTADIRTDCHERHKVVLADRCKWCDQ